MKRKLLEARKVVLCITFVFGLSITTLNGQSCTGVRFVDPLPEDMEAVQNNSVILPCKVAGLSAGVTNANAYLYVMWLKDGYSLTYDSSGNITGRSTYSMLVNVDAGQFNLQISPVSIEDEGSFVCQVSACNLQTPPATLTVYVEPDDPVITSRNTDGSYTVISGETAFVVCTASNANPAATVVWREAPSSDQTSVVTPSETAGLFDTTNTLTFAVDVTLNGQILNCDVDNAALDMNDLSGPGTLSQDITLDVLVAPTATYVTTSSGETVVNEVVVKEGDQAIVTCNSINARPAANLTWYKGAQMLLNQPQTTVTVANSSYDLYNSSSSLVLPGDINNDGVVYSCYAINDAIPTPQVDSFILQVDVPVRVGVIIAACVGIIVGIILIILIICCLVQKNKKNKIKEQEMNLAVQAVETNGNVHSSSKTIETPVVKVETEYVGDSNPTFTAKPESSEESEESSEESDEEEETSSEESSDEEDQELSEESSISSESAVPPPGDTFSLSSSIRRSDRGSPVHIYDVVEGDADVAHFPTSPMTSWMPSLESFNTASLRRMTDV